MKKLLLLLVCTLPLLARGGVVVTNYITDTLGNPIWSRVVFTPFTPSTVFGGTNVLGPSVGVPCTNGVWRVEVLPGWFLVDQGIGQPKIPIFTAVGDTTNGLAYFAIAATNPIPTFAYSLPNVTITNSATNIWFSGTNYYETLAVTNNLRFSIWRWLGPTNTMDFTYTWQDYITTTDMEITNFINFAPANWESSIIFGVRNEAATNVTLRIPANIYTNSVEIFTIYPGTERKYSFNHDDLGYHLVTRLFQLDNTEPPPFALYSTNLNGWSAITTNGFTGDLTVLTNGANTATYHFTNGLLRAVTAP